MGAVLKKSLKIGLLSRDDREGGNSFIWARLKLSASPKASPNLVVQVRLISLAFA